MKHLDEGFVEELEGKIDETFKETEADEKEVKRDQVDPGADITDLDLSQDTTGDMAAQHEPETMVFDLTEEQLSVEKKQSGSSGPGQVRGPGTVSRPYHPMEISTNTIVTRDNVEFAVRKFVKDLKECLRFSKAISVRFEIKTVDEA